MSKRSKAINKIDSQNVPKMKNNAMQ